jgi:hypothetical protein
VLITSAFRLLFLLLPCGVIFIYQLLSFWKNIIAGDTATMKQQPKAESELQQEIWNALKAAAKFIAEEKFEQALEEINEVFALDPENMDAQTYRELIYDVQTTSKKRRLRDQEHLRKLKNRKRHLESELKRLRTEGEGRRKKLKEEVQIEHDIVVHPPPRNSSTVSAKVEFQGRAKPNIVIETVEDE